MSFSRQTSIDLLLERKLLSRRAYNALAALGYNTLGDILSAHSRGVRFSALKGMGHKCENEISELSSYAHRMGVTAEATSCCAGTHTDNGAGIVVAALRNLPQGHVSILSHEPAGVGALERIMSGGLQAVMAMPDGMPRLRVIARRKALLALAAEICRLAPLYPETNNAPAVSALQYALKTQTPADRFSAIELWDNFTSPRRRRVIERQYELLREQLPVRARNLLNNNHVSARDMAALFGKSIDAYRALCPGRIMKKSLSVIYDFNREFERAFHKMALGDDRQAEMWAVSHFLPFLFGPARRFVREHYVVYGQIPLFFLIQEYLQWSINRSDRIFKSVRGITGNIPQACKEVAAEYGLSAERVRQIVEAGPYMLQTEWYRSYDMRKLYPEIAAAKYISTAPGGLLDALRRREHLKSPSKAYLQIIAQMCDCEMYERGAFAVIIEAPVAAKLGCREIFDSLENIVTARRSHEEKLDLRRFAAEHRRDPADDDVTEILRHVAVHGMGCAPVAAEPYAVMMPRTWIDVAEECVQILTESGTPMHISDIFNEFKRLNPGHKFTSPDQLRRMLWHEERIRPVGKRSIYALASWTHVYFGSIRDLLRDCLEASDHPLPLDEIAKCVHTHYPDVRLSSLYASLMGDHMGRFVQYEEGFGLSNKVYPGAHLKSGLDHPRGGNVVGDGVAEE